MKKTILSGATVAALALGVTLGMQSAAPTEGPALAQAPTVSLQARSANNLYVSSENGSNAGMNCNRAAVGAWEQFELVTLSGGDRALKGSNGRYVSSENGTRSIRCNRFSVGAWERFGLETTSSREFVFIGNNNKLVSSENGFIPMRCNRNIPAPTPGNPFDGVLGWERFYAQ